MDSRAGEGGLGYREAMLEWGVDGVRDTEKAGRRTRKVSLGMTMVRCMAWASFT